MKLLDWLFGEPIYQAVIVHYARARACYIYTLKPRRWPWSAKFFLNCQLVLVDSNCEAWITTTEVAKQDCEEFRNWLGENRVGR